MITFMNLETKKYSEKELEKYINDFNVGHWSYISKYQTLSEPFIEKHKDLVNWLWISRKQVLSESFIEEFKDKVYWYCISEYQKLSENFLLNHLEYIDIEDLKENKNISKELFEKVKFMKELQS
jgi:hypothetical protein